MYSKNRGCFTMMSEEDISASVKFLKEGGEREKRPRDENADV